MDEKKKVTSGEEYIWEMRTAAFLEDSDMWRNRRSQPLKPGETSTARKKGRTKLLLPMTEEHATKVLASLVPDEIIYNIDDNYSVKQSDSCILFGDVSGFTDLCEMYNKTGKGGPSRLTTVLNNYIGSMVQEVITHNGDILKFSGDAFLAAFKCSDQSGLMADAVHGAIDTAIMIQRVHGTYETDVGVVLQVKLAVAAGQCLFAAVGDENSSYYIEVGQPIMDVKAAEKVAQAGEIIVSPSAWNYVNSNEYQYESMSDRIHIKVTNIGTNWRPVQRPMAKGEKTEEDVVRTSSSKLSITSDTGVRNSMVKVPKDNYYGQEEFSIRPSVNYAAEMNMKEDLRPFIIPPIMRSIDLDEPIEYLTEMRQIVIVFMNIVTSQTDWYDYIKLIDDIYKLTCDIVNDMQGCVNKMSIFDKDLMFVILFGLRGYKSELESQTGLRCASECHQAISKIPSVITTSLGVTTGVTYCGVVGHTLRREYTVISLTVNKAARLMMAYPNKVTCDRETFLHSKLEASNFILQEQKALKGITNVGPVYEFMEQPEVQVNITFDSFPLLGRTKEIEIYMRLIDECVRVHLDRGKEYTSELLSHNNVYLINGAPRIGKTRLLNELVYSTPPVIPVNRVNLTQRDGKIPYRTIEYILSLPLSLRDLKTAVEREGKLKVHLEKIKVPEFFCALNKVFSVHFDITPAYSCLNNQQKVAVLSKILQQLCSICFKNFWVIAIDNAEFIDWKSWKFINVMIDMDMVLLVMTMGKHTDFCSEALAAIDHPRIQKVDLLGIDKWYHAGLACQILDVVAVPPELEKLIQAQSHGNPGWIESFLISLLQAGGVMIQRVFKSDISEFGLVSPPLDMLVRVPQEKYVAKDNGRRDTLEQINDHWKMYKFSYRGSELNLMKEKIKQRNSKYGEKMQVCIITPSFRLEDFDIEFSMDVVIIKMFDTLTSFEQLMLKCSSVLGEFFPRDMLLYIINVDSSYSTALAVKKLFELRVLGCARGDFTQGEVSAMVFRRRSTNPSDDNVVKCECVGIQIQDACSNLPKYASCGYIRFKSLAFCETTYNLLTDTQKKEFHIRAIKYLEKETRRCRACGNGFFVRILGRRYDESFVKRLKRRAPNKSPLINVQSMEIDDVHSSVPANTSRSSDYSSIASLKPGQLGFRSFGSLSGSSLLYTQLSELPPPRFCTGLGTVYNYKQGFALTRTFSYADFSSCQCPLILDTMYTQMVEHYQGAELIDRMVDTLLEYAYICITSHNIPQAMKILNVALNKLNEKKVCSVEDEELVWTISVTRGRIETLTGHARLELGQLEEAYNCFKNALKYYGHTFPSRMVSIKLNTFLFEIKQRLGMYLCPLLIVTAHDETQSRYCDDVSYCLSLLCHLYKQVYMWDHAELAAAWSLAEALRSDMDFYGLCVAYTNMLEICHHLNKQNLCVALEFHALRLCHRKTSSVEADELKAIAMLYSSIFNARTLRADIERSIHIGYITLRICTSIHAVQISLEVLPILVQVLLIKRKLAEVSNMIMELEYYAAEDTDNSGRTWFYALCVGYQLESGYTIAPFRNCEKFYHIIEKGMSNMRDQDAARRFYTVMWLWCVRNDEWEAATFWYTKACDFMIVHSRDSLNNMFTSLYLLEGLLLFLVAKIDKRNVERTTQAYKEIDLLVKAIGGCGLVKILLPRFYHLKAYYKYIKYNQQGAHNLLSKAKKLAEKQENMLELAWLEHSHKAWNNNLSGISTDFWKEHCEPDNLMDYHEVELNDGKLGLYTLPTPLFY